MASRTVGVGLGLAGADEGPAGPERCEAVTPTRRWLGPGPALGRLMPAATRSSRAAPGGARGSAPPPRQPGGIGRKRRPAASARPWRSRDRPDRSPGSGGPRRPRSGCRRDRARRASDRPGRGALRGRPRRGAPPDRGSADHGRRRDPEAAGDLARTTAAPRRTGPARRRRDQGSPEVAVVVGRTCHRGHLYGMSTTFTLWFRILMRTPLTSRHDRPRPEAPAMTQNKPRDRDRYEQARHRVDALRGFYGDAGSSSSSTSALSIPTTFTTLVNRGSSPPRPGIGLVAHGRHAAKRGPASSASPTRAQDPRGDGAALRADHRPRGLLRFQRPFVAPAQPAADKTAIGRVAGDCAGSSDPPDLSIADHIPSIVGADLTSSN